MHLDRRFVLRGNRTDKPWWLDRQSLSINFVHNARCRIAYEESMDARSYRSSHDDDVDSFRRYNTFRIALVTSKGRVTAGGYLYAKSVSTHCCLDARDEFLSTNGFSQNRMCAEVGDLGRNQTRGPRSQRDERNLGAAA
ncbi:MAG: hypothetical protein ACI915_005409 [Gammaproteobacteria bacterium]|jgi:hypothetical protein